MRLLSREISSAFACCYHVDLIEIDEDLLTLGSAVATKICNSKGNLQKFQSEIHQLLSGDKEMLAEINRACQWDWDEDPTSLATLREILKEILKALEFRIAYLSNSTNQIEP